MFPIITVIFFMNITAVHALIPKLSSIRAKPATLGEVYENIENHNVDNVYFSDDLQNVYFQELKDPSADPDYPVPYRMARSNPLVTDRLITFSEKNKVNTVFLEQAANPIRDVVQAVGQTFDFFFMPVLALFILRSFFSFQQTMGGFPGSRRGPSGRGGGIPFYSNPNEKQKTEDQLNMQKMNISLKSWAGSPEIFEECTEIVSYLKNATVYKNAGAEIPKGILLEGPPGTGKTLLAKAIASETDAWFLSVSASEFIELFVGLGAQKVRNLFAKARENKPAIIFIDEIDSVGRQRGAGINMGNDEREQTLNQLLAEMDGFAQNDGIIVIAATNRRDVLDAALLRPGRFDRVINVPLPDRESRRSILGVHTQNKTMDPSIQLDFLSEATGGFSGAELKNLVNEAAIYAARAGNTTITQQNLEDALEKSVVGIVKRVDTRSEEARMRVAIHEIGHAFLAAHFKQYFQLKKVTIQSTYNGAGGYTLFSEYPDILESGLYTKDLLQKRLVVALGGKAAETVFYGKEEVSLGAVQDLKQANSMARRMIGNYGMGEELEVFFDENMDSGRSPFLGRSLASGSTYSDKTSALVDKESLCLVKNAYSEAIDILEKNQNVVSLLVSLLINGTTLTGSVVSDIVNGVDDKSDDN
jgi:cell division protease FtsH